MEEAAPAPSDRRRWLADPVVAAGLVMVLVATAFRAWALYPSWFYFDDFELLIDSQGGGVPDLLEPFNGHLMVGGRLVAWAVEGSGQLNWALAATITLGMLLLANLAALWMFTTLFGRRWAVLVPCALYWFSSATLPATMWWIAALNQVPMQMALFLAVGAWVRYLRGREARWLVATLSAVLLGLLFYVKALLIFPLLGYLAVVYFARGSIRDRARWLVGLWPAVLGLAVLLATYVAYYRANAAQPVERAGPDLLGQLAENMVVNAFATSLVGGPWDWVSTAPPNAFADPPAVMVHATWVAVASIVAVGLLTRRRTTRAWVLLAGYLVGLVGLLLTSRAPVYGPIIGLEYRYLTDGACVAALCLALAFLRLPGAPGSSARRDEPLLLLRVRPSWVVAAVALVVVSSVVSQMRYVRYWHEENVIAGYLDILAGELRREGRVDLVDVVSADSEYRGLTGPDVSVRAFLPLLQNDVRFPLASGRLGIVATDGRLHRVLVQPGVVAKEGPREDCGWLVGRSGRDIPLTGQAFPWTWWVQIGYLASTDSAVTVSAGDSSMDTDVRQGLNTLYVNLDGTFDEVRIDGLDDGATVCVDTVVVGQPVPGEVLE